MNAFKSVTLKNAPSVHDAPPRRPQPSGVLHFTIGVTDLDRSRRFYEDMVGCSFWRQNDTTVFMHCGAQHFVLSRTGYHTAPNRGRDTLIHHAFIVAGEQFDAAAAYLEANGIEVLLYEDTGHRSFPGRHLYFHDPDGNTIEFVDLKPVAEADMRTDQGAQRRPSSHLA